MNLFRRLLSYLRPSPVEVGEDDKLLTILGVGSRAVEVDPLTALLVTLVSELDGA